MAYRLEIVTEVREWLHQLRRTDRTCAILVGQAITAVNPTLELMRRQP